MNKNDTPALREALRRIDRKARQLPFNTAEIQRRVMNELPLKVTPRHRRLRAAAVFIGVLLLSALAYAVVLRPLTDSTPPAATAGQPPRNMQHAASDAPQGAPVRFDNVRLDSVLSVVSTYYNSKVEYRRDEARSLMLLIEWNPQEPLSRFLELINNFDGISIRQQQDTLIVE